MKHEDDTPKEAAKSEVKLGTDGLQLISLGRVTIKNWWFEAFSDGTATMGRVPKDGPKVVYTKEEWLDIVSATCPGGQAADMRKAIADILVGKLPQAPALKSTTATPKPATPASKKDEPKKD